VRESVLGELRATRQRQANEIRALIDRALDAGAPTHQIADALGVSRATLWRRYHDQLTRGRRSRPLRRR
jgi:DNA invertase Pin-like site-specific DNA recombinase